MFFFGEFPYTVDDRNRVPIPPPFRAAFEKGVVMMPGVEPCIALYTHEAFEAEMEGIRNLPGELKYVRDARRQIFARVRFLEKPDGQGRVSLEPKMIESVGLGKEVVVVGADSSLEIWDRAAWDEANAEREAGHERALEEVGNLRSTQLGVGGAT
jgi:MraZ protein